MQVRIKLRLWVRPSTQNAVETIIKRFAPKRMVTYDNIRESRRSIDSHRILRVSFVALSESSRSVRSLARARSLGDCVARSRCRALVHKRDRLHECCMLLRRGGARARRIVGSLRARRVRDLSLSSVTGSPQWILEPNRERRWH